VSLNVIEEMSIYGLFVFYTNGLGWVFLKEMGGMERIVAKRPKNELGEIGLSPRAGIVLYFTCCLIRK